MIECHDCLGGREDGLWFIADADVLEEPVPERWTLALVQVGLAELSKLCGQRLCLFIRGVVEQFFDAPVEI